MRSTWLRFGVGLALILLAGGLLVLLLGKDPASAPWQLESDRVDRPAARFDILVDAWCHAPASALDRIEVDETPEAVTVTPYVDPGPSSNHACSTLLPATFELDEPLGTRTLIGGRVPQN